MKKAIFGFSVLLMAVSFTGCDTNKNNELKIVGRITDVSTNETVSGPVTLCTIKSNDKEYYGGIREFKSELLFSLVGDSVEIVLDTEDFVGYQKTIEKKPDGTVYFGEQKWWKIKSFKNLSK